MVSRVEGRHCEMAHSFEILNSKDLYLEFLESLNEYRDNQLSSGKAVVCSILCWHIIEWMFQEFSSITQQYPKLKDLQNSMKQQCPSLAYIQDIANGSKHRGINRYTPVVSNTKLHNGLFSGAFSKGFDVDRLMIDLDSGGELYFDEEIEKVNQFIKSYFQNHLDVSV